jgi:hypothetical protein
MSRLGHHRQRPAHSSARKAKPRLKELTDKHKKANSPESRRALRNERAWLTINSLTSK